MPLDPREDEWPEDYEATFEDFWRVLVTCEDGTLDPDKVKRELHDYRNVLRNVSLVYDHVTNGRVSKPNTLAGAVIAEFEDIYSEWVREDSAEAAGAARYRIAAGIEALGCPGMIGCNIAHGRDPEEDEHVQECPVTIAERVRSGEIGGLNEGGGEGAK